MNAASGKNLCRACRLWKPLRAFSKDRKQPGGWASRCKECQAAATKRSRARRRKQHLKWHREYMRAHRDQYAPTRAKWLKRSKDTILAAQRRRYEASLEDRRAKARARYRKLRLERPEFARQIAKEMRERRRARKLGVTYERVDLEKIAKRDGMRCHICHRRVKRRELNFDHVIPLSKGGAHTEKNLAVSHRRCNQKKGARTVTLF